MNTIHALVRVVGVIHRLDDAGRPQRFVRLAQVVDSHINNPNNFLEVQIHDGGVRYQDPDGEVATPFGLGETYFADFVAAPVDKDGKTSL